MFGARNTRTNESGMVLWGAMSRRQRRDVLMLEAQTAAFGCGVAPCGLSLCRDCLILVTALLARAAMQE